VAIFFNNVFFFLTIHPQYFFKLAILESEFLLAANFGAFYAFLALVKKSKSGQN
jgi:hypothetical protein